MKKEVIAVDGELMGIVAMINSFATFTSAPRIAMLCNQIRQACMVASPDIPLILHSYESQLRAYDIRMPENGIVVSVHYKYRNGFDSKDKRCPLITVIYQKTSGEKAGEYDCVNIHEFNTNHLDYGSRYVPEPIIGKLRKGLPIAKDTIFARSPSKLVGDIYSTSVTCNVLAVGDSATTEDGFLASDEFCIRAGLLEVDKYTGSWGKKAYLLNSYGTLNAFKGYPDIGEKVRPDGLLMAFRTYHEDFGALEMTNEALMTPMPEHDIEIYATPGSVVYDILVESGIGETTKEAITPVNIAKQSERYINQLSNYYKELLEVEATIFKENKHARFSEGLLQILTKALADKPNAPALKTGAGGRVRRCYRRENLDEYRIVVKTYNPTKLNKGAKITDLNGNKGVICGIRLKKDMPIDSKGNVADLLFFFKSVVARLNTGGMMEGFCGAAIRDLSAEITERYNSKLITGGWNAFHQDAWDRIVNFYRVFVILNYEWATSPEISESDKINHINVIIEDVMRVTFPLDSPNNNIDLVGSILTQVQPTYGKIQYTDFLGRKTMLRYNGFMSTKQMIVLEKTKLDLMAVSSGVRQIHGLLTGSSRVTRNANPSKTQAVRNLSETEIRMLAGIWGGELIAQYMAFTNDPRAHKHLIATILRADDPMIIPDIESDINGSRALKLIKDVFFTYGIVIRKTVSQCSRMVNTWLKK
jgi:hypothetical protein